MLLQVTFDPGIILQYMDSLPTNKQPIIHGSSHKKNMYFALPTESTT